MASKKSKQPETYIDILSDFGWKYYFGREENKINLINFLNSLLEGEHTVVDLQYTNVEEDGDDVDDRKVVFDLRCVGVGGEVFLVEMQLQNQDFFFDRAVTYTSRTISRLAKKGFEGNGYELPPVYFVAVLGFRIDKLNKDKYYYSAKIIDEFDQEILYPKLSYKMLVLPNFMKKKTELDTFVDQWMYLMKHCHEMNQLANYLDKRIFSRIFAIGELANLTPDERMAYISSLDRKRDYVNTIAFAKKEALEQGIEKGIEKGRREERAKSVQLLREERAKAEAEMLLEKKESAKKMLKAGLAIDAIADFTGLSVEQIEKLK